jgi:hypothetical protein
MYEQKTIYEDGRITKIEESTIAIPIRKFDEFVRIAEQVEAVKRVYSVSGYLCTDDVLAILDIEKKEENEDA